MGQDSLQCSPFGRELSVLVHRLPRGLAAPLDWELERGFHLSVLGESMLELNLRPRVAEGQEPTLPLLTSQRVPGATRILVWQKRPDDEPGWNEFVSLLGASDWSAGLILSRECERTLLPLASLLRRRPLWKSIGCPVVQAFQDTPSASFFTVEKNLFALGRIGRRVERVGRIRGWLPW